jgi:hypothetical protein
MFYTSVKQIGNMNNTRLFYYNIIASNIINTVKLYGKVDTKYLYKFYDCTLHDINCLRVISELLCDGYIYFNEDRTKIIFSREYPN